jgi:triosephosphate isomerase
VANYLNEKLKVPVNFVDDCIGEKVKEASQKMENGQILFLENLRFHPGEKKNDKEFVNALIESSGAEVYVNEAFSACHRAHASVVGLAKKLESFAGFALLKEVAAFDKVLGNVKRPFMVVMGGAKINDKVGTIKNLCKVADMVLLGGGIANVFLKAGGIETHKSYLGEKELEKLSIAIAKKILADHKTERSLVEIDSKESLPLPKIVMPIDVLAAQNKDVKNKEAIKKMELLRDVKDTEDDLDLQYLDIGPKTVNLYKYLLSQAKTIFWNGPLGVFENRNFAGGSRKIAKFIADDSTAVRILGGGETNAVVNQFSDRKKFDHVSTAGGAALEYLEGKGLPGIEAL